MSYPSDRIYGRAETAFRDAFERLKAGAPKIISRPYKLSQNSIAREAGLDSSSLKKSRFPELVEEIQRWISEFVDPNHNHKKTHGTRTTNIALKQQVKLLKQQRDSAMALLVQADAKIITLTLIIASLQSELPSSNISPISGRGMP